MHSDIQDCEVNPNMNKQHGIARLDIIKSVQWLKGMKVSSVSNGPFGSVLFKLSNFM